MEQFKNFWGGREIPFKKTEEEAWSELQARLETASIANPKVIALRPMWAAAAAIALLVAGYLFLASSNKELKFATEPGAQLMVELPDGSTVNLAPNSTVTFMEKWEANREVMLSGQGFFEVKAGSNFEVKTAHGEVSVLGTSFDVKALNSLEVYCESGKVLVEAEGQKTVLTQGMSSKIQNKQLVTQTNAAKKAQWLEGNLSFENESLENVLNEIERFYNVEIECAKSNDKFYTGQFTLNNLEEALTLVCAPFALNYSIDGNMKITIQ